MNSRICQAIAGREVIRFFYDGGLRTVEPHAHGVSRKDNECMRGYQVGGHSESGQPVGWKMFTVGEMGPVTPTGATFAGPRPGYKRDDEHMISIHCQL